MSGMKPNEFWECTPKEIADYINAYRQNQARWVHAEAMITARMFGCVLSTIFGKTQPFPTFEECFPEQTPDEQETEEPIDIRQQQQAALMARVTQGRLALLQKKAEKATREKLDNFKKRKQQD